MYQKYWSKCSKTSTADCKLFQEQCLKIWQQCSKPRSNNNAFCAVVLFIAAFCRYLCTFATDYAKCDVLLPIKMGQLIIIKTFWGSLRLLGFMKTQWLYFRFKSCRIGNRVYSTYHRAPDFVWHWRQCADILPAAVQFLYLRQFPQGNIRAKTWSYFSQRLKTPFIISSSSTSDSFAIIQLLPAGGATLHTLSPSVTRRLITCDRWISDAFLHSGIIRLRADNGSISWQIGGVESDDSREWWRIRDNNVRNKWISYIRNCR